MGSVIRRRDDGSIDQQIMDFGSGWLSATISGDSIDFSQSMVTLIPQSGTTDDLKVIFLGDDSVAVGKQILIRAGSGYTITLKHLGVGGNLYITSGVDVVLNDVHAPVFALYDGTYWIVQANVTTPIVGTPPDSGDLDPGETVPCVSAGMIRNWIKAIVDAARAQLPASTPVLGLAPAVSAAIRPYFDMVVTVTNVTPINNIAITFASGATLGDQATVDAEFTSTEYDNLQCEIWGADADNDGAYSLAEFDAIVAALNGWSTVAGDMFAAILAAVTYIGMNNALTTDAATSSPVDCGTCDADWCYVFDFTASNGGWALRAAGEGAYSGGTGWVSAEAAMPDPSKFSQRVVIEKSFTSTVIRNVTLTYNYTAGSAYTDDARQALIVGLASSVDQFSEGDGSPPSSGTGKTSLWSGSETIDKLQINIWASGVKSGSGTNGSATIVSVLIRGDGSNPFGSDNC